VPCLMNVLRVLMLCLRLVRGVDNDLLCCWIFLVVISFCSFYLNDGMMWIPRHVYSSF
jgi:hypothetical protein